MASPVAIRTVETLDTRRNHNGRSTQQDPVLCAAIIFTGLWPFRNTAGMKKLTYLTFALLLLGSGSARSSEPSDWHKCQALASPGPLAKQFAGDHEYRRVSENLPDVCKPDILYTWMSESALERLLVKFPESASWPAAFDRPLYAHISPISTFAYGTTAVRMKLRPDVRFFVQLFPLNGAEDFCSDLAALWDPSNSVLIRPFSINGKLSATDYILCSPRVIESVTVDTDLFLSEMTNAIKYLDEGHSEPITYVRLTKNYLDKGVPVQFDIWNKEKDGKTLGLDDKDWSREHLEANLKALRLKVNGREPIIRVNEDVPDSKQRIFRNLKKTPW